MRRQLDVFPGEGGVEAGVAELGEALERECFTVGQPPAGRGPDPFGAVPGTIVDDTLESGTITQKYYDSVLNPAGADAGGVLAPEGTPHSALGLPPRYTAMQKYLVNQPIRCQSSIAEPAWGSWAGGPQHHGLDISQLLASGTITKIPY